MFLRFLRRATSDYPWIMISPLPSPMLDHWSKASWMAWLSKLPLKINMDLHILGCHSRGYTSGRHSSRLALRSLVGSTPLSSLTI